MTRKIDYKNYDQHREKMAEKSRLRSLSGRDIFPIPPITNPYRRKQARKDLRLFAETYFSRKCYKPWGNHHIEFINRLQTIILNGGKQAIAMPRGSGKSVIVLVAAIWALLYGYSRMLLIIAKNKDEAKRFIDSMKSALRKNEELLNDFPDVCHAIRMLNGSAHKAAGQLFHGKPTEIGWTKDLIRFPMIPGNPSSGATVIVAGLNSAIRGKNIEGPDGETIRPDFVIGDDLQSDALAKSRTQIEDLETKINGAVEGLAEDGKRLSMVTTWTVIRPGDAADRYLNPEIYPLWQGLRYQMLPQFPSRMELWEEYRRLRIKDHKEADDFYISRRKDMDAGAEVSWPSSFEPPALSALHYAMNLWCDDELSFYAERQNEPKTLDKSDIVVDPSVIRSRINGHDRGIVPGDVQRLTAFVDVHSDILYWTVCGWTGDFTGYVIDYGTFPEQNRSCFSKRERGLETLKACFPTAQKRESYVQLGIEFLLKDLSSRELESESGGVKQIDRIFIDSGYMPDTIYRALNRVKLSTVRASLGRGIKASETPMSEYTVKHVDNQELGYYWICEIPRNRQRLCVKIDVNYWKADLHDSFSMEPSEPGSMSFFGTNPEDHRMIADHVGAEDAVLVKCGQNEVYEFKDKVGSPDNHYFDCLVGCRAAASYAGIKTKEIAESKKVFKSGRGRF